MGERVCGCAGQVSCDAEAGAYVTIYGGEPCLRCADEPEPATTPERR